MILPRRPRSSAEAYAKIWTPQGSPLLVHARALAAKVQARLGETVAVDLAMRYGEPSITAALDRFERSGREPARRLPALRPVLDRRDGLGGGPRSRARGRTLEHPGAPGRAAVLRPPGVSRCARRAGAAVSPGRLRPRLHELPRPPRTPAPQERRGRRRTTIAPQCEATARLLAQSNTWYFFCAHRSGTYAAMPRRNDVGGSGRRDRGRARRTACPTGRRGWR